MNLLQTDFADIETLIEVCRVSLVILVIVGLAWLATIVLRRKSAGLRNAVWNAAITACLVSPILAWSTPPIVHLDTLFPGKGGIPRSEADVTELVSVPTAPNDQPRVDSASGIPAPRYNPVNKGDSASFRADSPSKNSVSVLTLETPNLGTQIGRFDFNRLGGAVRIVWAIGFAILVSRLFFSRWLLGQLSSRDGSVNDSRLLVQTLARQMRLKRAVNLVCSPRCQSPLTWGIVRPVIVLPVDARQWDADTMRSVIQHELAHVARWDSAALLLARIAECVFWFHPAIWLATRRSQQTSEQACDDIVLLSGLRRGLYGQVLLRIAAGQQQAVDALATSMARSASIEKRLRSIMDPTINRAGVNKRTLLIAIVASLMVAWPLSAIRATSPDESQTRVVAHVASETGLAGLIREHRQREIPDLARKKLESMKRRGTDVTQLAIDLGDRYPKHRGPICLHAAIALLESAAPDAASWAAAALHESLTDYEQVIAYYVRSESIASHGIEKARIDSLVDHKINALVGYLLTCRHIKPNPAQPIQKQSDVVPRIDPILNSQFEAYLRHVQGQFVRHIIPFGASDSPRHIRAAERLPSIYSRHLAAVATTRSMQLKSAHGDKASNRLDGMSEIVIEIDFPHLLDQLGPFIDEITDQAGLFGDLMEALRNDPNGPRIDVRDDLLAALGSQVTIRSWPATRQPHQRDFVALVKLKDHEKAAALLDKLLENDPEARKVEKEQVDSKPEQHGIWEIQSWFITAAGDHLVISNSLRRAETLTKAG